MLPGLKKAQAAMAASGANDKTLIHLDAMIGSMTPKERERPAVINAKRMKKIVNSLEDGQALADLTKKQQTRFAKSSLRVQKACDRAGYPLPQDNLTARTAAGL